MHSWIRGLASSLLLATAALAQAQDVELFQDADFRGRCIVLGPGRHAFDSSMNDRISSVRPR